MLILGFSLPHGPELIIILVIILLVFGGKKIPELMKGLGKGVRGFKDGLKGLEDEINKDDSQEKN
jgi:sec-independent protein translocase protein TatA